MGTVIDAGCVRMKREERQGSEDRRIRILIRRKFSAHKDYGLILNLLEEYGSATVASVIRSQYDPTFAR